MSKNNKTKKSKKNTIELSKQTTTSVIAVQRQYSLNVNFLDPKTIEELYATVPETSRIIDLRGDAIIYRGYEITPRNDSSEAKEYANVCSYILEKSGGVNFIQQFNKNTDAFGNGYIEEVPGDDEKIIELAHIHPKDFGYELETFIDSEGNKKSRVKLDNDTKKPVGFASYKYNELDEIYENNEVFDLNRISHLKYKVLGDGLYGISIFQPMYGSILRKLKLESNIEVAGNLVAAPKMVITGEFETDEDARDQAKEAASLDINDVIILDNGKTFDFVNPGSTNLPELREIFVTNITTASGIPRPALTSESAEINKATLDSLMKQLRENMRANMNRMRFIIEREIFLRIGISYGYNNILENLPIFTFPEDTTTEEEIIEREEKKANTIHTMSNSLSILNSILTQNKENGNKELDTTITETMTGILETLNKTVTTFNVNNDQDVGKKEEELPDNIQEEESKLKEVSLSAEINSFTSYSIDDEIDVINQPDILLNQHLLVHSAFDVLVNGGIVYDLKSGLELEMTQLIDKHNFYVNKMEDLGITHQPNEEGKELDKLYFKFNR